MNRRTFLKMSGGVAVVVAAPSWLKRLAESVPILYGDGVHDDQPALQALLDGKVIEDRTGSTRRIGDVVYLASGSYRVGAPIKLNPEQQTVITSCRFDRAEGFNDGAMLEADE